MKPNRHRIKSDIAKIIAKPIAHRGLHNVNEGIIENSLTSFEMAIKGGYAIECDLQLTKDKQAIVFHDEQLERLTNKKGKICDTILSEALKIQLNSSKNKDKIQSFPQFLEQVNSCVPLMVELKPQSNKHNNILLAKQVLLDIENYKGLITFISFVPDILVALKKFGFAGPTGIIVERFIHEKAQEKLTRLQRFLLRHLVHFPITKFDYVDCDKNALDLPMVRLFRALGFPTATWTIKSQQEADIALKSCDQITFEGFIPK